MARDSGSGFGTVLTIGAVGIGGYLLWQWWNGQQSAASGTVAAGSPAAPTPTAAANASTPVPSASSISTLDALYRAMVQAAAAAGHTGTLTADQWGYYLGQVARSPAPDALQAFPSFNRSTNWPNISSAQYWAGIAPLVAQQKGLSGLGFFGGLGRIAMGRC